MSAGRRVLLGAAGLLGAGGVAAAAAASHLPASRELDALALIALTHAPALLALARFGGRSAPLIVAGWLLAGGALLFCADLGLRHVAATGLFAFSAPLGGVVLIAGWAGIVVAAAWPAANDPPEGP